MEKCSIMHMFFIFTCSNLDFFVPKKINVVFSGYKQRISEEKIQIQEEYERHILGKSSMLRREKTQTSRNVMLVMKKVGCMHLTYKDSMLYSISFVL